MLRGDKLGNNSLVTGNEFCDKIQQLQQVLVLRTAERTLPPAHRRQNDARNVHFNDALLPLLFRNKFHTLDKSARNIQTTRPFYIINQLKNMNFIISAFAKNIREAAEVVDLCHNGNCTHVM